MEADFTPPEFVETDLPGKIKQFKEKKPAKQIDIVNCIAKPWERQPSEGWRAFHAFTIYRDLKPNERFASNVAKSIGKSESSVYRLSKKWRWDDRVCAYLEYLDEQKRKLDNVLRQEMRDRHARLCINMLDKAQQRLETLDLDTLTARDVVAFIDSGIKNERLSRGEATENVKSENKVSGEVKINHEVEIGIGKKVVEDARASELACELLERLAIGEINSSGHSAIHIEGKLETSKTSESN